MTSDEVIDLLTLMASYDRRKVGKTDVAAWKLAVGDLSFADGQEAVVLHYTASRDWMMPVDLRQRVKEIRAARIAAALIEAPPPELTDDPHAYRQALIERTRRAADGLAPPAPPAAALPPSPPRPSGAPTSLRSALSEIRDAMKPRTRQAISTAEKALRQAEQSRKLREEREAQDHPEAS